MQRNVIAGLLIGATMLWSNDFAIPTAGLFSIFYCSYFYFEEKATWKFSAMIFCLTAILSWGVLLSLITVGHPFELIKFNFIDVAKDQWWYYGPYGPSTRIFEFSHLPRLISGENYFPLVILLMASMVAIKTKKIEHVLLAGIGLTLFAGGSLASLGGHIDEYFGGFYYWGAATTILVFLRGIQLFATLITESNPQLIIHLEAGLLIIVFFCLLIGASVRWIDYKEYITIAKNDSSRFYVPELGGYLGKDWMGYIGYARQNKNRKVIEDYWGIWSALNNTFPSWPVDSVIHALGSIRNTAKLALADADFIISTRYAASPQWQPWGLSQNYWFYDELLSSWEPYSSSPTTIVWRKIEKIREYSDIGCNVSVRGNSFTIASKSKGYYKVILNYTKSVPGLMALS